MTVETIDRLRVSELPIGAVHRRFVHLAEYGTGEAIRVPVIVARGRRDGPVLGVTAAIHGNELNGIPVIHRLLRDIDLEKMRGTLVAVPVVNVLGFARFQRVLEESHDLNHLMPGRADGHCGQVYAHRFVERIASEFGYLVDLHTASFGRINSVYVRSDLKNPAAREMALLQRPQIIVHNAGADGTLRAAATARGIPSITVEIGDPQRFQTGLVELCLSGLKNVMRHLDMQTWEESQLYEPPVLCRRSYWLYTDAGGLLEVFSPVATHVRAGQVIARVTDIFGEVIKDYVCPEDGVVVGKSTNPVNQTGARILHLGIVGEPA